MITPELKQQILEALQKKRDNFSGSDTKFAINLGINSTQYSRIKNGDTKQALSKQKWIGIARRLNINPGNEQTWETANTPVYQFVSTQIAKCQEKGISSMLCDLSDIGKSHAAKEYAKKNKNAIYVDCSQVKSKQQLIRHIAKEFGLGSKGRYADIYEDLVFYIRALPLPGPIIILDEYGDLKYDAFLESKALWNATEHYCSFYAIGADGLRAKIRRGISYEKVGFTEIFSRFGKKYGNIIPAGKEESNKVLQTTAQMIIKANNTTGVDSNKIFRGTMGDDGKPSLRRIRHELTKQ